jgi:hypothetical protein
MYKRFDMLTIKNYIEIVNTKIRDTTVFIHSIEETDTQYRIVVANNHNIGFEMSLERNPIGRGETALYELWYWDSVGNVQRSLLAKNKIDTKRKMIKRITELIIK